MRRAFTSITPTEAEQAAPRGGDEIVSSPDTVMDRAFTLDASPEQVWPWLMQLGKRRAGWYLPRTVEKLVPRRRRAIRHLDPRWPSLTVGDVIPDYGGRDETLEVTDIERPRVIVFTSQRGAMRMSWSLTLTPTGSLATPEATRVHVRLRLGPVRHKRLVRTFGELFDALTIAGMARGLRERLDTAVE